MIPSWQQPSAKLLFSCSSPQMEGLGGTRWEPSETALINNATVSEGTTISPNNTGPFWKEWKEY